MPKLIFEMNLSIACDLYVLKISSDTDHLVHNSVQWQPSHIIVDFPNIGNCIYTRFHMLIQR